MGVTFVCGTDLGEELAENVIQRFSEANFSRINNKSGFLMGIIRRIQQDGPDKGSGDLDILPRPVRHKLKDLIDGVWMPLVVTFPMLAPR